VRVTTDDIERFVEAARTNCQEAIVGDPSVAILGQPTLAIVALNMGSTALWLLGQILISLRTDAPAESSPEPIPEPETLVLSEPIKRRPGRPRKIA
jgi:hypothetical protein